MKPSQRFQILFLAAVLPMALVVVLREPRTVPPGFPIQVGNPTVRGKGESGKFLRGDIMTPLERERLQMTPLRH